MHAQLGQRTTVQAGCLRGASLLAGGGGSALSPPPLRKHRQFWGPERSLAHPRSPASLQEGDVGPVLETPKSQPHPVAARCSAGPQLAWSLGPAPPGESPGLRLSWGSSPPQDRHPHGSTDHLPLPPGVCQGTWSTLEEGTEGRVEARPASRPGCGCGHRGQWASLDDEASVPLDSVVPGHRPLCARLAAVVPAGMTAPGRVSQSRWTSAGVRRW